MRASRDDDDVDKNDTICILTDWFSYYSDFVNIVAQYVEQHGQNW